MTATLPPQNPAEALESRDFYELMQQYRHDKTGLAGPFEAVKSYLRASLALQPAPIEQVEPVLHQVRMRPMWLEDGKGWTSWDACSKESYNDHARLLTYNNWQYETRALYLAVQPAPLDDDQIISVLYDCNALPECDIDMSDLIHVIRCVEAHHGIGAPAIDQTKGDAA